MNLLLGLLATLAVGYTAQRLTLAARGLCRHEQLLLFGGLFIAQAVLTQLLAGVLLRLTPLWVALLNLGLALLAATLLGRGQIATAWLSRGSVTSGARSLLSGLVGATAGRPLAWILVAILVLQSALVLWTAAILPPQGWDEWWYHLPPIAHWVETGHIDLLPVAAEWQDPAAVTAMDDYQRRYRLSVTGFWANVYPLNVETWAMWSLLFLHNDRWVDAAQWPFILLGALAVYGLAHWATLRAPGPLLAGLLWALLPINQMQARTAYTDTALAALTLVALLFFLRWAERVVGPGAAGRAHFLAAGLFIGLALGSKPPALAYAVLLGLVTLVLVARRPAGGSLRHRLGAGLGQAFALAALGIAFGGFWYLRTWVHYGNPVYPFTVQVLGHPVFPGLGSVESLIYVANTPPEYLHAGFLHNLLRSWFEASNEAYSFYTRTGGFGAIWAVLGLPALAAYALRSAWVRDRRALTLLALGGVLLFLNPGNWWPRYSILVPGIGLVAAGWLLAGALRHPLLRPQVVALTVAAVIWSLLRADLSLAQPLPAGLALPAEQRTIGRLFLGDLAAVDERVPAGASIGYAPMTFIYPLHGPDLERRVEQVDGAIPAEWFQSIRRAQVQYVTTLKHYGPHYAWAKQSGWLEEIPTQGEVALFAVQCTVDDPAPGGGKSAAGQ